MAGAVEVVLDVQLPLPLLLRHHCIVVSVVVQQLVTGLKGPMIETTLFMANEKSDHKPLELTTYLMVLTTAWLL